MIILNLWAFPLASQSRIQGQKNYEIVNHLGNITTVVSDRKFATPQTGSPSFVVADPDLIASNDYYPYGILMERRGGTTDYRFGFQGQERDDEVKGTGNAVNYTYRMHDARLGRFFAVDPLAKAFAYNSSYAFSENTTQAAVELEGLEKIHYSHKIKDKKPAFLIIHENTKVNQELDAVLQDQATDNGKNRRYYDILITVGDLGENAGITHFYLYHELVDGVHTNDKYVLEKPELFSDAVEANKRGVLVIVIDQKLVNEADAAAAKGNWEKAGEVSFILTHEKRAHALDVTSRGGKSNPKPEHIQHGEYHFDPVKKEGFGSHHLSPTPNQIRKQYPNSPAGKDLLATDKVAEQFQLDGRTYDIFPIIPKPQLPEYPRVDVPRNLSGNEKN